jgi:hypothetical protein
MAMLKLEENNRLPDLDRFYMGSQKGVSQQFLTAHAAAHQCRRDK